jgi:hypothetical protein
LTVSPELGCVVVSSCELEQNDQSSQMENAKSSGRRSEIAMNTPRRLHCL